jgi:lysozyme family protein
MAAATYPEAIRRLLMHEGGYTNHPSDPGGPTNFGITIHDYRKYVKADGTADDVRRMSVNEAKAIYRAKYWNAQACDRLPAGVDYSLFDYGVNSGIGRSGKVLRRVCGLPDDTHVVNDQVLAAVARRDPAALVAAINDERLAFLKRLRTWPTFGKGWGRRVAEVRAHSLALAKGTAAAPARIPDKAPGKGEVAPPPTKTIGTAAGTGTVATGIGFWDWVAAHPAASVLVVAAVVAAVGIGIHLLTRRRVAMQHAPVPDTPVVSPISPEPAT